jgi:hypothetical protein
MEALYIRLNKVPEGVGETLAAKTKVIHIQLN